MDSASGTPGSPIAIADELEPRDIIEDATTQRIYVVGTTYVAPNTTPAKPIKTRLFRITKEGVIDPTYGVQGEVSLSFGPTFNTITRSAVSFDERLLLFGTAEETPELITAQGETRAALPRKGFGAAYGIHDGNPTNDMAAGTNRFDLPPWGGNPRPAFSVEHRLYLAGIGDGAAFSSKAFVLPSL